MNNLVKEPVRAEATAEPVRPIRPVIMCGGSGKRLWPVSRKADPKQFQRLYSDNSLIQETAKRVRDGLGLSDPLVLCNGDHRFLVQEHLSAIGVEPGGIVCEPEPRNTAAALTVAALILAETDPDAIMLAMPADHHIGDTSAFAEAVRRASLVAHRDMLVTFGIVPDRPETGYGYIERGAPLTGISDSYAVQRFIEKPARAEAESLIADERFLWNSGIFMLPVMTFLEEVRRHSPETAAACCAAHTGAPMPGQHVSLNPEAFADAPDVPVDIAVMERTDRAAVVPTEMAWSDIGTWPALRDVRDTDESGNVVVGNALVDDVSSSYIRATDRLVVAAGLDDVVVIDTPDAVFVGSASKAVQIDRLVAQLSEAGQDEANQHVRVHRPWGFYQTIERGERFQVKHILVKPGEQLSLQMHHHRAEHWVIVSGTGRITRDDESELLHESQTIHIPVGSSHRLENPGLIPLQLIEVQVGPYLGEDDIVRLEDQYGRA